MTLKVLSAHGNEGEEWREIAERAGADIYFHPQYASLFVASLCINYLGLEMGIKTGVFINVRLGSSRLKRKQLLPVNERPVICYLIDRINHEFKNELLADAVKAVITSSRKPENKELERFKEEGLDIFFGSDSNIPLRHLQAATALSISHIVAVEGDSPFCSPAGMRRVYEALMGGEQYVRTDGLPIGLKCSGYSTKFLEASLKKTTEEIIETGWDRIFDADRLRVIDMPTGLEDERLRITLDYDEDYRFFKKLISILGDRAATATDSEIIDVVIQNRLYEINCHLADEYMAYFKNGLQSETKNK